MCEFRLKYPNRYAVYHLYDDEIVLDGKIDEAAWEEVPWTESFGDIQGRSHWSQPWLNTHVKMRYDDEYL